MIDVPKHTRCPDCGGNMEFDITEGKLLCQSCNTRMSVVRYDLLLKEKAEYSETVLDMFSKGATADRDETGQIDENVIKARSYTCSSCGGRMSPGALGATDHCPFCGNAIVFVDKYRDQRFPDFIIPFKQDRKYFFEKFRKLMDEHLFLPDNFREKVKFENVKAIYVPFWLFDVQIDGTVKFVAEKQRAYGSSKNRRYEHNVFSVENEGSMLLRKVPQDAATGVDDDITHALEPFRYDGITEFSFGYLSGLDACIYDLDDSSCFAIVKKRAMDTFERFITDAEKFDYYSISSSSITCKPDYINYALFPIWMCEVTFEGHEYRYAMNGQTGKGIEELPVSRFKKNCCIWTCVIFLSSLLMTFMPNIINKLDHTERSCALPVVFYVIFAFISYYIIAVHVTKRLFKTNKGAMIQGGILLAASVLLLHRDIRTDFIFNFDSANILFYINFAVLLLAMIFSGYSVNEYIHKKNTGNTMHLEDDADQYTREKDRSKKEIFFTQISKITNGSSKSVIRNPKKVNKSKDYT
jgi:predicted RNA-binding Zn-ribbon protein involved in translation (DUF1610 family)